MALPPPCTLPTSITRHWAPQSDSAECDGCPPIGIGQRRVIHHAAAEIDSGRIFRLLFVPTKPTLAPWPGGKSVARGTVQQRIELLYLGRPQHLLVRLYRRPELDIIVPNDAGLRVLARPLLAHVSRVVPNDSQTMALRYCWRQLPVNLHG